MHLEKLVELGMERLRIAVLGALDKKRHPPRRQGRHRMLFEAIA